MIPEKQKYAFLDRDGTIIWEPEKPDGADPRETFPLKSAAEVKFMDGALEGMKALVQKGYALALATNQTFLGTPKHPREIFNHVMQKIAADLEKEGMRFSFVMTCPHGPDEGCECRKPKIGGVKPLLESGTVDLQNSIMFGDREFDRQFAENLGVRFVRIQTNGTFELPKDI